MIIFIIILVLVLVLIKINFFYNKEKFLLCEKIPSGPYKNKCTNIQYKNNILYAICPKQDPENTFKFTHLDLKDCVNDTNDCDSINIDIDGNLICE